MWIRLRSEGTGELFNPAPFKDAAADGSLSERQTGSECKAQSQRTQHHAPHARGGLPGSLGFPPNVEFITHGAAMVGRAVPSAPFWAEAPGGAVRIPRLISVSMLAGSARVPGGLGLGFTKTRPAFTRTLKVETFSTNGGGDAPVSGRYWYPCQGQVMQPLRILPSPRRPFWCWHTFESAEIFPSYLKIATRSPDRQTIR